MNERIKELIAQSTTKMVGENNTQHDVLDTEKLAKLIVKECMTLCEDVAERNDPAIACYYEIKQKFGVNR